MFLHFLFNYTIITLNCLEIITPASLLPVMKSKDSNNMITIAIELKSIYKIKEALENMVEPKYVL